MKRIYFFIFTLYSALFLQLHAQDTFSIVALDSITGEVGSAGASCVNLLNYPNYTTHFLGELIPGVGAINTQAYYLPTNQTNARNRMMEGMSPQEIIAWLEQNDAESNPAKRQYGIVGFVDGHPESAGYTGVNTDDYKNHVTGPNYSIQGNILLGQMVLDSMEARFLREPGDLACKLMAALQGAKMVGADTRCAVYGTSSLFAFVKVSVPEDEFNAPSFLVGLKTGPNTGVDPIDSLQVLFDAVHYCPTIGFSDIENSENLFSLHPNPATETLTIEMESGEVFNLEILDSNGKLVYKSVFLSTLKLDISHFISGNYFVRIQNENKSYTKQFVKQKI